MRTRLPKRVISSINDFRKHRMKTKTLSKQKENWLWQKISTKHFNYYIRPLGKKAPKEDLEKEIKHLENFCKIFKINPSNKKIYYIKVKDRNEMRNLMGFETNGLARKVRENGIVFSTRYYHPHEVSHVLSFAISKPNRFITEGLAVLYGWDGEKFHKMDIKEQTKDLVNNFNLRDMMDDFKFREVKENVSYSIAASFLKYIREKCGISKLKLFYKKIDGKNYAEKNIEELEKFFAKKIEKVNKEFKEWILN